MYFCEAQRLPSTSPRSTQEHLAPCAQRTPHPLPSPMGLQDPESPRSHCWDPLCRVPCAVCPLRPVPPAPQSAWCCGCLSAGLSHAPAPSAEAGRSHLPAGHGASAQPPRVAASHSVMNRIVSARTARTRSMPRVSQVTCWRCIFRMGLIRAEMWPRACLSRRRGEMIIKTMLDVPSVAQRPPRCSNPSHCCWCWLATCNPQPEGRGGGPTAGMEPAGLWWCRAGSCGHHGPCSTRAPVDITTVCRCLIVLAGLVWECL